jgi:glyoxylase-like metal-dependent hydrolase (beta-lactamase superfamily II)
MPSRTASDNLVTRRHVVQTLGGCAAHLAAAALVLPVSARRAFAAPRYPIVAAEPFGRLERVADGVWALISTPFGGDRTTLANGGLIAGTQAVLAIEGFFQPAGAAWLAAQSLALTGRYPTHVLLTHHHADHVTGVSGYARGDDAPIRVTAAGALDLGGRSVRIRQLRGHTASDLVVVCDDPAVTFAGDLMWNGIFPNYVDAEPVALRESVTWVGRQRSPIVPGHGAIADAAAFARYATLIDEVEAAARRGFAAGVPAATAASGWTPPATLGEWTFFNRSFTERAFAAWYKQWS